VLFDAPSLLGHMPSISDNTVELVGAGHTSSGLHSTSSTDFTLPQLCTKFNECTLSYASPFAWNALSKDLCTTADPVKFRKQLKTHYFTVAFNVH